MIQTLYVVYIVIAILLMIIIMMQKSKNQGLSVTFGGSSVGDSFFNKNKSKTFEGKLETWTKIGIFVFIAFAVVLNYLINTQAPSQIDLSTTPEGISQQEQQQPTGEETTTPDETLTNETTTDNIANEIAPAAEEILPSEGTEGTTNTEAETTLEPIEAE